MSERPVAIGDTDGPPPFVPGNPLTWIIAAFIRLVSGLNTVVGTVVAFGFLVLMGLVLFDVLMRYAFNAPTVWGHELVSFLFAGYILLGGGYALLHRDHVNMDIVYGRMPLRGRAVLDVLTAAAAFAYCWVLFDTGLTHLTNVFNSGRRTATDWGPIMWPFLVVLPVGAALIGLQAVAKFLDDVILLCTGRSVRHGR
ncbi:MAG: TRAP transporter small permease [Geminicoccaceae bacterium]|nr:MAG: TRAP transporter small permease [Geminicoccaceae bacterium]